MYKVFCDSLLLYDDRIENIQIFNPLVELELNKTGSFEFTIQENHPHYSFIQKLKSIVTVWQDDFLLFRGRVLNDELGFHNEKHITCEGDLSFLLDSIQRPFTFNGTPAEFLAFIINRHNSQVGAEKRFTVWNVTVSGALNVSEANYATSLETLQKQLLNVSGGHIRTRQENGVNYLDYLSAFNVLSSQTISFGKNLIDLKRTRKGEDIATALIPLGKKLDNSDDRLTIASVHGGLDYIQDDDAVAQYGFIVKSVTFDDVTDATALLLKGQAHLSSLVNLMDSIELTAADLATMDSNFESFHLGTQVQVTSNPHGINQRFLVSKLSVKLLDPAANKLTLGGVVQPFTSQAVGAIHDGKDGADGEDATVLRIDSSRGTVFKNNSISTTLTVAIYHGEKRIINKAALTETFGSAAYLEWSWQRMDEQTFGVISASDSRIHDDGFTLVLTPQDVDTKATFMCTLIL